MMDTERLRVFLNSLESDDPLFIREIEQYGRAHEIPIIKRETASLLIFLLSSMRAENVMEIGTAIGYSTLIMADAVKSIKHITTIEINRFNAMIASDNFKKAKLYGIDAAIDLIEGDAGEILNRLESRYDFVFLDAAKGQYGAWLSDIKRLVRPGGIIFADNILQDGTILESRFFVERRDRTIHSRMREYLYKIKHDDELVSSIVPIGDGAALSMKKI